MAGNRPEFQEETGEIAIILHVDMDAFYASVEVLERPELRQHPVVVGADPRGGRGRGVVTTCNYPARRFGIRSAMPISQAYRACPHAVFLRPRFAAYKEASARVMEVLADYADILQVVGMDEAYLDITAAVDGEWDAVPSYARSLQAAVRRATGLTCSVGAASTKPVAKIASDHRKPHGVTVVPPGVQRAFLAPLPLRAIPGCGPKTAARLADDGLRTIGDAVSHLVWVADLVDGRGSATVHAELGPGKSRGNERTFFRDVCGSEAASRARDLLAGLLERETRPFATLTVKVRYADFTTLTRAHTHSIPVTADDTADEICQATLDRLLTPLLDGRAIRLVGVRLSGYCDQASQARLRTWGLPVPPASKRRRHAQIRPRPHLNQVLPI